MLKLSLAEVGDDGFGILEIKSVKYLVENEGHIRQRKPLSYGEREKKSPLTSAPFLIVFQFHARPVLHTEKKLFSNNTELITQKVSR